MVGIIYCDPCFLYGVVGVHHEPKGTFKVNRQRLKPFVSGEFDKKKFSINLINPKE